MNITKNTLKRLIKEELDEYLKMKARPKSFDPKADPGALQSTVIDELMAEMADMKKRLKALERAAALAGTGL